MNHLKEDMYVTHPGDTCRAMHNFFRVGLGEGAMSLAEVKNMVALQSFTLGGGWGHARPGNFGDLGCSG